MCGISAWAVDSQPLVGLVCPFFRLLLVSWRGEQKNGSIAVRVIENQKPRLLVWNGWYPTVTRGGTTGPRPVTADTVRADRPGPDLVSVPDLHHRPASVGSRGLEPCGYRVGAGVFSRHGGRSVGAVRSERYIVIMVWPVEGAGECEPSAISPVVGSANWHPPDLTE